MKEIIRTNDLILISRIESIFNQETIYYELFDTNASVIEGSISAIEKRILVLEKDFSSSQKLINILTKDN